MFNAKSLIHIRSKSFVEYGYLQPEYAANLVISSEHYRCHLILSQLPPVKHYVWYSSMAADDLAT